MKANIIMSAVAALALTFIPHLAAQIDSKPANASGPDPYDPKAMAENNLLPDITITYEAFSMPIAKAREIMRLHLTEDKLYKEVVAAGKLERLLSMPFKSGQRGILENVTEYIYPTEFSPPQIPGTFIGQIPEQKIPLPVCPTATTKADVGDHMEIDPVLSSDAKSVDLNIAMSHNSFLKRGKWGQGIAEIELPQFDSQLVQNMITASIGAPVLIGTLNPPFGNGLAAQTEQNVWFCFVTPTLTKYITSNPVKTETKIDRRDVTLTYEAFSLPIAKAGEILRSQFAGGILYDKLSATGKVERLLVIRSKFGARGALANETKYNYPTEFAPPRLEEKTEDRNIRLPLPITPVAFKEHEIGDHAEFEITLSDDAKFVNLALAVDHTALVKKEKWGQGMAEFEQPVIESQKVTTAVSAPFDVSVFIGTLNPPFGNGVAEHAEQRVWFCFITPTINEVKAVAPKKDKR